jgi:hypothetical protein
MSKIYSGKERRKYVRVDEEDLVVCEPYDIHTFGGSGSTRLSAFTKNLSEGGILFESDTIFDIGMVLRLEIDIPGWEEFKPESKGSASSGRQPLIVLAKVVRVEDLGGGFFDIGVAFTAVDSDHQVALRKYLERAIKERVDQG